MKYFSKTLKHIQCCQTEFFFNQNPQSFDQYVEHPINNVSAMVSQDDQNCIGDMVSARCQESATWSAKIQIVATVKK